MKKSALPKSKGFAPMLLLLAVVVILLAAGLWFFLSGKTISTPATANPEANKNVTQPTLPEGDITSTMPDIIARGQNLVCDWKFPVESTENPFNTGKLWTNGSNGRSSVTGTVSGMSMEADALYTDDTIYSWINVGGTKTGIKFNQDEITEMNNSMTPQEKQQAEQVRASMIFHCEPWTPDASKFVVPTDITFQ